MVLQNSSHNTEAKVESYRTFDVLIYVISQEKIAAMKESLINSLLFSLLANMQKN